MLKESRNYEILRRYGTGSTVQWAPYEIHKAVLERIKEMELHLEKGESAYVDKIPGTCWEDYEIELYRGYGNRSFFNVYDYWEDKVWLCECSSNHDWILAVS